MDNQQVTKNWFIGFLEGEGCFSAQRKHHQCLVRITNNERDLIDACVKFLNANSVLNYTLTRGIDNKTSDIYISTTQDCKTLYELLKSDMQCRLNELESILGTSTTIRETSLDLNWLAGILEAEGHFTIKTQWSKNDKVSYKPEVNIPNTNHLIIEKVAKTLFDNGLSWYVYDGNNPGHKSYQRISIVGFKRVNRFLQKMENLWIGRKTIRKTKLLKEFCDSRLSKEPKAQYSSREHELALEIKMKI